MQMKNGSILKESLSSILYHFCPIDNAYAIVSSNSFKLSNDGYTRSDSYMNRMPAGNGDEKRYPYYMCFSRTPYSGAGYIALRRERTGNLWKKCIVRFEIDGDMLNQKYTGRPVDSNNGMYRKGNSYYDNDGRRGTTVNAIQPYGKRLLKNKFMPYSLTYSPLNHMGKDGKLTHRGRNKISKVNFDLVDQKQMFEYEDRLFSFEGIIPNALKYVRRIDILCSQALLDDKVYDSSDIKAYIYRIMQKCGSIVHIYDSESAFNSLNVKDKEKREKLYKEYDRSNSESWSNFSVDSRKLYKEDIFKIAPVLGYVCYGEDDKLIRDVISDFELDDEMSGLLYDLTYREMNKFTTSDLFFVKNRVLTQNLEYFRGNRSWVRNKLILIINLINKMDIGKYNLPERQMPTTKKNIFSILNDKE